MKLQAFLLLHILVAQACAHSFLTNPDAYNRKFQLRDCKGEECNQACPTLVDPKKMGNTEEEPHSVWSRGEKVKIQWARNNHENGFVRFAIVPVSKMMARNVHKALAIYYGCFTQGPFRCSEEECGSDREQTGYSASIEIPTIYPDDTYVFALVWFGGGGVRNATNLFFADYWSCSYIKIKGGPLRGEHQPYFEVGPNNDKKHFNNNGDYCLSVIDAPGVCPPQGCSGQQEYMVPKSFKSGRKPSKLSVADIVKVM